MSNILTMRNRTVEISEWLLLSEKNSRQMFFPKKVSENHIIYTLSIAFTNWTSAKNRHQPSKTDTFRHFPTLSDRNRHFLTKSVLFWYSLIKWTSKCFFHSLFIIRCSIFDIQIFYPPPPPHPITLPYPRPPDYLVVQIRIPTASLHKTTTKFNQFAVLIVEGLQFASDFLRNAALKIPLSSLGT